MKWTLQILFLLCFSQIVFSCAKSGGNAPSSAIVSLAISPTSLIIPKSISTNLQVISLDEASTSADVTTKASCTSNNSLVTVSTSGQVSNSYTGSSIQSATITCMYQDKTASIPVTIVPATLQSLVLTKNSLTMAPATTQAIQVYGNFIDANSWVFALDMTNYVTWASTSSAVSSAAQGTVYGSSVGSATITASFGPQSVNTAVSVVNGALTSSTPKGVGLTGSYYDFTTGPWTSTTIGNPFERFFGTRIDSQVYFDWSTGTNNLNQVAYFGIRWTGRIYVPTTGAYTFYTQSDDGVRLWINDVVGTPVIDNWTLHANVENNSGVINLTGGQFYNVKMEYFENAGYSVAQLKWAGPSIAKQLIPQINLFPQ